MVNMESSPLLSICEEESRRVLQVPLAGSAHRVPPHPPPLPGDHPLGLSGAASGGSAPPPEQDRDALPCPQC